MYYFLIYRDGTHDDYIEKLLESVRTFGKQFQIIEFQKTDIDSDFTLKHYNILSQQRGGGYWLWKPYAIFHTLQKLNENDILFYLDSKYYFTEEFAELYEPLLTKQDLIVWKNKPNEPIWYMRNWCKMDVIIRYDMYDKIFYKNAEDCWGGAMIIKKTLYTMDIIQSWLEMCGEFENITDSPSTIPNTHEFKEHRHDQSMLSIVLHKNNIPMPFFEKQYLQNCRSMY